MKQSLIIISLSLLSIISFGQKKSKDSTSTIQYDTIVVGYNWDLQLDSLSYTKLSQILYTLPSGEVGNLYQQFQAIPVLKVPTYQRVPKKDNTTK